ncbi:MAG: phosphoglucosamine mutase [Actinomycetota bacterium]
MGRLFGTDGVRGVYGRDLTDELAGARGAAAARGRGEDGAERPRFVIGRDTRGSGPALEAAFADGARSGGADVLLVGVEPTPAIAFHTAALRAAAGVVISASHNPPAYNGIKFFGPGGTKLPDATEAAIEEAMAADPADVPGAVLPFPDAEATYADHVAACAEAPLTGLRLVVDCANGAASHVAPMVLRDLGADVVAIHDAPDGTNINEGCGALHPDVVAAEVVRRGADAGVAFDGDADRALFADAAGTVIDGDQVLAACALGMRDGGRLPGDTVVTTVMANLGFRLAMREAGIRVVETQVGDRYVLEAMLAEGARLGGEQSGHVIFLDQSPTGDGLLTAVRFLSLAVRRGGGVAGLAAAMTRFPQVLINVPVVDRARLAGTDAVWAAVRAAEDALGDAGRVLVRASGTEDLVRVMVEARSADDARRSATAIADVVRATCA